jgi:hypothetical protein
MWMIILTTALHLLTKATLLLMLYGQTIITHSLLSILVSISNCCWYEFHTEILKPVQSSLVINSSGVRHFDLRPVTFYDHFSL